MAQPAGHTLGDRIRRLRHERRLSLAQVAGSDFSRAFLSQVETGRSQASTRTLRIIAARLGTHVEYLLQGTAPTVDRDLALERARIMLATGRPRRALQELGELVSVPDWPFGFDARLCACGALRALGREEPAEAALAGAERLLGERPDVLRRERLRRMQGGPRGREEDARPGAGRLASLGDRALRAGDLETALERYREARILLEASR
ncbi:MAG: helix-turn-helix domain-containing protein [Candidatus Dormibacterales bacterium]